MRKSLAVRTCAALAAVLAGMGVAGCGGDADKPGVATVDGAASGTATGASAAQSDSPARAREFAQCMRDNGVAMEDPDPTTGKLNLGAMRDGADGPTVRKALEACRDKAPQAIKNAVEPDQKQLDAMRKFAQCMRDAGIPVNDPGPDGFAKDALPTGAPGFQDALNACQKTAPLRPGATK